MNGMRAEWDQDEQGREILRVTKFDGEITLNKLAQFLQHEQMGMLSGSYAILLNSGQITSLLNDEVDLVCIKNPDIFATECDFY